jgi:hypothetical protein
VPNWQVAAFNPERDGVAYQKAMRVIAHIARVVSVAVDAAIRRSTAQTHGYFNGAGDRSAYLNGGGVSEWSYSNETQSCRFGRRGVAGWSSCHECSCRRTWRIRRWPLGRPHGYAIWRAIDWKRDWDITNLQSIEPVHCDAVTGSRRLAGKSWITVSLTCDAAAGDSICHLHPQRRVRRPGSSQNRRRRAPNSPSRKVCGTACLVPDASNKVSRHFAAYEEALRALHISDRDDPINKVIAQRIIEGARAGVRDPNALCE